MEQRIIRAQYNADTITVYQAYNKEIAESAVKAQTFVCPPFKKERMTWIKPSFLWMMYRCGWATKTSQEHVLAISIKRSGFEWALQHSCLSHFDSTVHESKEAWAKQVKNTPVRIQWDPERDIKLQPLPYRSLQVGLSGKAVDLYLNDWITGIEDITEQCKAIKAEMSNSSLNNVLDLLPKEEVYPLPDDLAQKINASI